LVENTKNKTLDVALDNECKIPGQDRIVDTRQLSNDAQQHDQPAHIHQHAQIDKIHKSFLTVSHQRQTTTEEMIFKIYKYT